MLPTSRLDSPGSSQLSTSRPACPRPCQDVETQGGTAAGQGPADLARVEASAVAAALCVALQHAGKGVVALCEQGRLLFADPIARSCLGPSGPLRVRGGRLEPAGADAGQLSEALTRLDRCSQPQFFTLRRPAGTGDGAAPEQRFAVTALPVQGRPGTACRVLILDPLGDQAPLDESALARWLGLTPAQARVAACLSRGLKPEAVARHCGRSLATVRTQIRAILERSGMENLQQLYRALAGLGRGSGASLLR